MPPRREYICGTHLEGCHFFTTIIGTGKKRDVMRVAKLLRSSRDKLIIDIGYLVKDGIVLVGMHDNVIEDLIDRKIIGMRPRVRERMYLCFHKKLNRHFPGEIVGDTFKHKDPV